MTNAEAGLKFDQMVADHNGKLWEVEDPNNRDQCFDVVLGYCDYLGIPREAIRHLNASQIWTQPLDSTLQYFDFIPNTTNGIPHKGDIIIFGGAVGHVSVANGTGDNNSFNSFDQNFPTGSPCHFQNHDYKTVLGWLRIKTQEVIQNSPALTDQTKLPVNLVTPIETYGVVEFGELKAKLLAKDQELSSNHARIQELDARIEDMSNATQTLATHVGELITENSNLKARPAEDFSLSQLVAALLKKLNPLSPDKSGDNEPTKTG